MRNLHTGSFIETGALNVSPTRGTPLEWSPSLDKSPSPYLGRHREGPSGYGRSEPATVGQRQLIEEMGKLRSSADDLSFRVVWLRGLTPSTFCPVGKGGCLTTLLWPCSGSRYGPVAGDGARRCCCTRPPYNYFTGPDPLHRVSFTANTGKARSTCSLGSASSSAATSRRSVHGTTPGSASAPISASTGTGLSTS